MIHALDNGGYVISSHEVWLPGIYDSERTARFAFRFPNEVLEQLAARICSIHGEDRPITKADLIAARAQSDERGAP